MWRKVSSIDYDRKQKSSNPDIYQQMMISIRNTIQSNNYLASITLASIIWNIMIVDNSWKTDRVCLTYTREMLKICRKSMIYIISAVFKRIFRDISYKSSFHQNKTWLRIVCDKECKREISCFLNIRLM